MFIKLPFIIEGIMIGLISAVMVFPALYLSVKALNYLVRNFSSLSMKISFDPFVLMWMFLVVIFISLLGSYRAAASFLK
jgi:cell division protein FtsX